MVNDALESIGREAFVAPAE